MKRILSSIVVLAILTSLGISIRRWGIETPNRTVEIVYDLPSLYELSATQGLDPNALLLDLKAAGVTTIAVQPTSVGELLLKGSPLPEKVQAHLPEKVTELGKFLLLPARFEPEHMEIVQQAGLKVAPKLNTAPWELEPLWLEYNPELIIVSGQGAMSAGQFYGSQATLALVEFATPQLDGAKASTMVRLHGISAPEMQVLSDERILNRYLRAVQERNLRVLYVRSFVDGEDSWERSIALLRSLQERLEDSGFSLGQAEPFAPWNTAWIWMALVGAGIWAAAILYGIELFPCYKKLFIWLGVLALAVSLALLAIQPILGRQTLALLAAILFPVLAMQLKWGETPVRSYISAALVALVGALFVVALLSGTEFLIKLQEFRGVKLMHVVPIALVVFGLIRPLRDLLDKDVPIRHLLIAGIIGLLGVVYLLRTGNFGLPVLGFEVKLRESLENILVVRPRTKELFLGHPALYLALHSQQPRKSWWLPVAVIGQISLVNTFTHTHTMLWVSLLRTFYGLLFGYLLGWAALKIFKWGKERLGRDLSFRLLRIR